MKIHIVKYKSGLTLIHKQDRTKKAVYFEFRFRAGLWNDPKDKLGLSHVLEHCMALSNNEYTKQEKNDFLKNLYYRNFTTTGEYINAFAYVSDEEFEEAFIKHCNYVSSFNINDDEFKNELKVIVQEIKRIRVGLAEEMFYLVRTSRFKKFNRFDHIASCGKVEDLAYITKQDVLNFADSVLTQDNCIITVYGNVSLAKTKKLIKNHVLPNLKEHTTSKFTTYYDLVDKLNTPSMFVMPSPDGKRSRVCVETVWESQNTDQINYYAAQILSYIYSSVARVFFRDKYGLTYNATMNFSLTDVPTSKKLHIYATIDLDCDESHVSKTLQVLPEFYQFLQSYPITEDMLKGARTSFRRSEKVAPISNYVTKGSLISNRYFDYGFFFSNKQNRKYKNQCKKLKAEYCKQWLKQLLNNKPYVYVVSNTTDKLPNYADLCKQIKNNTKWLNNL